MLVTTNIVPLEKISVHEISIVIPIRKQIEHYRGIANTDSASLPTVRLGRVNDRLFVLDKLEVYYGIKESRLTKVSVEVIDFKNNVEFIIEHVKLNKNPTGFNSLLLFNVVDYLGEFGIDKTQAYEVLQLGKTIDQKILELPLDIKAIEKISGLYSFLAEKLSTITIPYYILESISNCSADKQEHAARQIDALIKTGKISDSKFTWPSVEEIQTMIVNPVYHKNTKDSIIYVKTSTKQEEKIVENVISESKNLIGIPGNGTIPSYVINTKTKHLQEIKEEDTVTCLKDAKSETVFLMPRKAVTHLNLEESIDVKTKTFSNSKSLIKYLQNNPNLRGVLFFK